MGVNMGPFHKKANLLLLLQRFNVSIHGKDSDIDEPALVGRQYRCQRCLPLGYPFGGSSARMWLNGLPTVTVVSDLQPTGVRRPRSREP